jgi:hypothetical protein
MRRFLLHVLPGGFHRIRHYGLLVNPVRREKLATIRSCGPPCIGQASGHLVIERCGRRATEDVTGGALCSVTCLRWLERR